MIKNKFVYSIFAIACLAFSCQSDDETPQAKSTDDDCLTSKSENAGKIIEGEYIVALNSNPTGRTESFNSILTRNKIRAVVVEETYREENSSIHRIRISKEQAQQLQRDPSIKSLEPDRIIAACGCFTVVEPTTVTWNVSRVGYGSGSGKTAWILDTGIDTEHPDLVVDKSRSRSYMEGDNSFDDENGHGTHVAGIIGAANNNIGVLGIASGVSLVSLKVLGENGEGKLSSLLSALNYIKQNGKPGDVANISLSFDSVSEILEEEIKSIANKGIYFTLAAGNDADMASNYSPGRTTGKNIYTVSAVDSLNRFAGFSNFGNDAVDFAAPGVQILSTYKDGKYAILTGTSQAAPHVAGVLLINNGKVNFNGEATSDPDQTPDPIAHQ